MILKWVLGLFFIIAVICSIFQALIGLTFNYREIALSRNLKHNEKKKEFYEALEELRLNERKDKAKIKICENQNRVLRA